MTRLREFLVRSGLYPHARVVRRLFLGREAVAAEEASVDFYRRMLPPGGLAFDLGANVGEITEWLLRAGARVVAVEPQPECVAELRARCTRLPGLIDAIPAAVGRAPGTATLHIHDVSASSSLRPDWFGDPGRAMLRVPVITLADLIARYGVPDYVKVDVEGSEEDVFATLPHPLPLVSFEYVDTALDRAANCMEMLTRGRRAEANLALTAPLRFLLDEWIPTDELLRRLPMWLADGTAPKWGDIWIQTQQSASAMKREKLVINMVSAGLRSDLAEKAVDAGFNLTQLRQANKTTLVSVFGRWVADEVQRELQRAPIPDDVVQQLVDRCDWACCVCWSIERQPVILHHIQEHARGGGDAYENLVVLCSRHHEVAHSRWEMSRHPTPPDFLRERKRAFEDAITAFKAGMRAAPGREGSTTDPQGHSDVEALRRIGQFLDRPAVLRPFSIEGNMRDFLVAMSDIVRALNTGLMQTRVLTPMGIDKPCG